MPEAHCFSRVRRSINLKIDNAGAVAVEAAIVLPFLIYVVLGGVQFSIIMNTYITATAAAAAGLQAFNTYRDITGSYTAATTVAMNAAKLSAWKIASSDISFRVWVAGTQCSGDSACDNLLSTNGPPGSGGQGGETKFEVQMACRGLNLLPSMPVLRGTLTLPSLCPVIVQLSGAVQ
jgi:Flp pilus assembly protein TadG